MFLFIVQRGDSAAAGRDMRLPENNRFDGELMCLAALVGAVLLFERGDAGELALIGEPNVRVGVFACLIGDGMTGLASLLRSLSTVESCFVWLLRRRRVRRLICIGALRGSGEPLASHGESCVASSSSSLRSASSSSSSESAPLPV